MVTVRDTLDKLEQELLGSVAKLRSDLAPLERELANVRKAKAALTPIQGVMEGLEENDSLSSTGTWTPRVIQKITDDLAKGATAPIPDPAYANLTMKQLVVKALREHFPNGAGASELVEFFHHAWNRNDVVRSSLSPQLTRLKVHGEIQRDGHRWKLAE